MDIPAAHYSRARTKRDPKGVISISKRKPKIEKYDDGLPTFSYHRSEIKEENKTLPVEE